MYNPYQPYNYGGTYIPNYNFQNPYQQFTQNLTQQQMQSQTQQPSSATNTNKIFVSSIEDVKSKPLSANSDFIFLDNDKPILYQKTVDGKGQFEVKAFEIREIQPQERQKEDNSINLSNYVTLTEFEALKGQIDELKNKITKMSVQSELSSLNAQLNPKGKVGGNNEQSTKQ